ncbi:hypothetical protein DFH94DRAFT_765373 [Russula ochroleuca]|uniref:Uncharacterized protein n=1 Tax=Russula ochroleuca TaxID=152965 RepID=A0A9P5MPW3_9AGAM|nr:hypothetical protein DFH94DRAFT_765373 [Russula ochroleuca]
MLLKHGANVDAKDDKGRTPLHGAVVHGLDGLVCVLLEHGANAGAEDNEGRTPFQIVSAKGKHSERDSETAVRTWYQERVVA